MIAEFANTVDYYNLSHLDLRVGDPFTRSTHLLEVAYCDVIKRQMTSWLTLNGDIRQKLTFKGNSGIFAGIFTNSGSKYIFADHVAGDRAHAHVTHGNEGI